LAYFCNFQKTVQQSNNVNVYRWKIRPIWSPWITTEHDWIRTKGSDFSGKSSRKKSPTPEPIHIQLWKIQNSGQKFSAWGHKNIFMYFYQFTNMLINLSILCHQIWPHKCNCVIKLIRSKMDFDVYLWLHLMSSLFLKVKKLIFYRSNGFADLKHAKIESRSFRGFSTYVFARFFVVQADQNGKSIPNVRKLCRYTKRPYIIPTGRKLYQTYVKYTNILHTDRHIEWIWNTYGS
jgi:hypothetical protein